MPTALGTIASHRTATTTGGLPVAGAVGWWDASQLTGANGSRVTTWPDLSGAGRNLTGPGPTLTTNGLNGKTVATYNPAANNSLTAPMVPFNQFFIVAKYDAATFVSYDGLLTDSANLALLIGNDGTSNWYNAGAPFDEYRKDGVLYSSPWPAPMQTWAVLSGSRSGPFILNDILLGYDRNIADRYWSGGIAELLIYDRVLSTVERQQVESYLYWKWMQPASPIPTTGLVGWWDADDASTFSYSSGTVVSQWRDKSGNNRHTTTIGGSPTVVPASMNTRSTLYITGYPCRLEIAAFAAAYTTAELFAVLQIKTLGGTGSRSQMLSMWGTNNEIGWYPFAGPPSWWYENWGIAERPAVGTVDNATLLAPHIHNIRVAPGSLTASINGATIGTAAATVAFRSSGTYMFGNDFINEIPDGYIAEVVMYDRVLSTVERQQVEAYLADKWITPPTSSFDPLSIPWYSAFWASDPQWTPPADGGAVSSWRNAGTQTAAATQATPALQPIYRAAYANLNGKPAVEYDGVKFLYALTDFFPQPIHWYFVTYGTGISGGQYSLTDGNPARNLVRTADGGTMLIYGGSNVVPFGTQKFGATHLSVLFNGTNTSARANGQSFTGLNPGSAGQQTMWVGASQNGSYPYPGGIAFFACINRELTTQELSDLSTWAVAYYGVPPL